MAADVEQESSERLGSEAAAGGHPDGLLAQVDALSCRLKPLELKLCSPQQLVHVHQQLGDVMKRVVVELERRLSQDGNP